MKKAQRAMILAEQESKLKAMREKLRKEELTVLRGADYDQGAMMQLQDEMMGGGGVGLDGSPLGAEGAAVARANAINAARTDFSRGDLKRPRAASGRTRPPDSTGGGNGGAGVAQAQGSLAAGKIQIDEDDDDDEDDSSMIDDDDEDDSDEDDSDDSSDDDDEDTDDSDRRKIKVSDSDEE